MQKRFVVSALLITVAGLALCAFACSNWDQQTYQTLSASKAVIDQAAADYNAGKIAQTAAARDAITKARQAQTAAVDSFEVYAAAKVAAAPNQTISAREQAVIAAVALLPPAIAALRAAMKPIHP